MQLNNNIILNNDAPKKKKKITTDLCCCVTINMLHPLFHNLLTSVMNSLCFPERLSTARKGVKLLRVWTYKYNRA